MTLIAATLNYKRPVVISDCLVSAEGVRDAFPIPLLPDGYSRFLKNGKESLPIALKQKMYIVNRSICIVFATDDENEIKTFLPVFKDYFPEGSILSNDRIHEFLQKYGLEESYSRSSFLIFYFNRVSDKAISVGQFYRPKESMHIQTNLSNIDSSKWNILEEPIFETTWAHATGARKFLNIINQPMLHAMSTIPKEYMESAIQMNGTTIARILALQATAEGFYSIQDGWGGAFEMAYFNGTEFEKMDDYCYLIFHGQFDDYGNIGTPWPIFVMYLKYIKNVLYITEISGRFEEEDDDEHIMFSSVVGSYRVRIFPVLGVDLEDETNPLKVPADWSFSTEVIGVGYSLITKANTMYNPGFFSLGTEVKVVFRQDRNVKIFVRKNIWDRIKETSKQQYPLIVE